MNCDFCQQRLELYLLGELDPSAAREVDQHLSTGCVTCGEELASLSESIDCLIDAAELLSPPTSTWDKIDAAIESNQQPATGSLNASVPVGLNAGFDSQAKYAAIGLLAVACGFGLMMLTLWATVDRSVNYPIVAMNADRTHSPDAPMQFSWDLADDASSRSSSENLSKLVAFHKPDQPRQATGSMVFDFNSQQIHVHVQMQEPHKYAFWFVTVSEEFILGGHLDKLSADHYGKVLDIPVTEEPIAYTVITIEPSDGDVSADRDIALVSDTVIELNRGSL